MTSPGKVQRRPNPGFQRVWTPAGQTGTGAPGPQPRPDSACPNRIL